MSESVKNTGNFTPPFPGKGFSSPSGSSDGAMGMKGQSTSEGIKPITTVSVPRGSGSVKDVGNTQSSNIAKKGGR